MYSSSCDSYHGLLGKLELSSSDYKFIRDFNESDKFFIKYSGPKVSKPKRVGFFKVTESHFEAYSELLGGVIPVSRISVFSGHQRNGHCLNTIGLLLDLATLLLDKLVIVNLLDHFVWGGVVGKLGLSSDSYYFKNFTDCYEDLVIDLTEEII